MRYSDRVVDVVPDFDDRVVVVLAATRTVEDGDGCSGFGKCDDGRPVG